MEQIGAVPNEDDAVKITGRLFPDFTEQEIREFYRQAKEATK